jgi:hypothetical protein
VLVRVHAAWVGAGICFEPQAPTTAAAACRCAGRHFVLLFERALVAACSVCSRQRSDIGLGAGCPHLAVPAVRAVPGIAGHHVARQSDQVHDALRCQDVRDHLRAVMQANVWPWPGRMHMVHMET